jgi:hypothetical protein
MRQAQTDSVGELFLLRHAKPCAGIPVLSVCGAEDVDGRA